MTKPMRDFEKWLLTMRESIAKYTYYTDFKKVSANVEKDSANVEKDSENDDVELKKSLSYLNQILGPGDIETKFKTLLQEHPKEVLKGIPILLGVRGKDANHSIIPVLDDKKLIRFDFSDLDKEIGIDGYLRFMRETGLFDFLQSSSITNLIDYVYGVEVGLDSNARKNRGGKYMEELVEGYLKEAGVSYKSEMKRTDAEKKYGVNLSGLPGDKKAEKRFDFVVKTEKTVYAIESNFYSSSGSKLNETARSYKEIALEAKEIDNFEFVWITDGFGWKTTKRNLEETFSIMEHLYNINDLENGIFKKIFK